MSAAQTVLSVAPTGYSRISVKCIHCGRNQTRKSRAGLWFKCNKCGKRNPGPAVTAAVHKGPEKAVKEETPKPTVTVHKVAAGGATGGRAVVGAKKPKAAVKKEPPTQGARGRSAAPKSDPAAPPPETKSRKPKGMFDRVMDVIYG